MKNVLENAKATLKSGDYTCVIINNNDTFTSHDRGILPIIICLRNNSSIIKNGFVADKVIGKAAAMLLVYGGVSEIYADVMSKPALEFLEAHNVESNYENLVDLIRNRDNTGMCPMESRALNLNNANEAFDVFNDLIK